MFTRFVYGLLIILTIAMLLFVAGFICFQIHFTALTTLFYSLASRILMVAFMAIALFGVLALCWAVWHGIHNYSRPGSAATRKIWAMRAKKASQYQRAAQELRQIKYLNHMKHHRILAHNNKKHLRALYKSVRTELQTMREKMPVTQYQAMTKNLRQYHRQANTEAMLELRRQFPCP